MMGAAVLLKSLRSFHLVVLRLVVAADVSVDCGRAVIKLQLILVMTPVVILKLMLRTV
ncbi:hypothetical protein DPMN_174473 [Dreissena polymorpha]|uniref:Uncharacterized protein n=1 Tax=Dreissena polymorpha TaxID=45954 RepID=A0A9D4IH57_DREPO|nr:hypothetical protein DPMN_174472 [Dreissena polymorpha]KAH3773119.1 hypothetical protein DPMN_174473 [Dreissena polymorpha]